MPRILVLYATREGQTGKVATRIAEHLAAAGAAVEILNARDKSAVRRLDLAPFDLLVFGGSMHAGGVEGELVDFINGHREQIAGKRRSFFLVLLSAATKDPELRSKWLADALAKLKSQVELDFDEIEMVAGALHYSKYSAPTKWVMQKIAREAGEATDTSKDYEYTDWQQVEDYARKLVASAG